MPFAYMELGIILTTSFYLLTGVVCYYCWSILGEVIRKKEKEGNNEGEYKDLTLERVAGLIYGNNMCTFLEIITAAFSYGTCVGYAIFIQ